MAVYTEVTLARASELLARPVTKIEPLPGGIENSNYRVNTETASLVLTVIERQELARLLPPLAWMDELNQAGLPVPYTVGEPLSHADKPVILTSWCEGDHLERLNRAQASAVGALLAEMHTRPPITALPNDMHDDTWLATRISAALDGRVGAFDDGGELLQQAERVMNTLDLARLPQGAIHADVFRDNLLFADDTVSGLVDFHYACTGAFLYDLAIAANDLCTQADGTVDTDLEAALLWGYKGVRRLTDAEERDWRPMLVVAALRFWVSRLWDQKHTRPGPMPQIKDPGEFERRLRSRLAPQS